MMIFTKKLQLFIVLLFGFAGYTQTALLPIATSLNGSGGDLQSVGTTPNASYSLGQLVSSPLKGSGNAYTFFQGVQISKEAITLSTNNFISLSPSQMQLWPNPTSADAYLSIPTKGSITGYKVYNSQGVEMFSSKVRTSKVVLPTQDLSLGIYYLQLLKNNQSVKVFKLVKN